jgi:hypothetical protein
MAAPVPMTVRPLRDKRRGRFMMTRRPSFV